MTTHLAEKAAVHRRCLVRERDAFARPGALPCPSRPHPLRIRSMNRALKQAYLRMPVAPPFRVDQIDAMYCALTRAYSSVGPPFIAMSALQ
jgi:hypothetical protein